MHICICIPVHCIVETSWCALTAPGGLLLYAAACQPPLGHCVVIILSQLPNFQPPPPLVPHHSLYQLHGHPTDNTNCLWIKGKKDESAAATAPDSPSILAPLVPPAAHQQHLTESRGAIWHQPGASDSFHLNASKYTSSSSSSPSSSSWIISNMYILLLFPHCSPFSSPPSLLKSPPAAPLLSFPHQVQKT